MLSAKEDFCAGTIPQWYKHKAITFKKRLHENNRKALFGG